jgi:Zn-dependent protease with chaperone function
MILALGLLLLSAATVLLGPTVLARWTGPRRSPLVSVAAWQLASWSVVINVALATVLIAAPSLAAAGRLPAGLESCLAAVRDVANPADSRLVQAVAVLMLCGMAIRLVGCAVRSAASNHRHRSRHRQLLSIVGRRNVWLGADVVADPTPMVYCVPGRGGRVVFTSAAMEKLSAPQRAAVFAHECAHLRGRHHLLVASACLLARAFPRVRLFSGGCEHTARLIEIRADDLASRGYGRRTVAEALLALADMDASAAVLSASAVTTAARIERLLAPDSPLRESRIACARRAVGTALCVGLLATSPVVLAAAVHAALCLF